MVIQMASNLRWVPASVTATFLGQPGPQSLWEPDRLPQWPDWQKDTIAFLVADTVGEDPIRISANYGWAQRNYGELAAYFPEHEIEGAFNRILEAQRAGGAVCLYKVDGVIGALIWWQLQQTG